MQSSGGSSSFFFFFYFSPAHPCATSARSPCPGTASSPTLTTLKDQVLKEQHVGNSNFFLFWATQALPKAFFIEKLGCRTIRRRGAQLKYNFLLSQIKSQPDSPNPSPAVSGEQLQGGDFPPTAVSDLPPAMSTCTGDIQTSVLPVISHSVLNY